MIAHHGTGVHGDGENLREVDDVLFKASFAIIE